jgi:hypothetical protein
MYQTKVAELSAVLGYDKVLEDPFCAKQKIFSIPTYDINTENFSKRSKDESQKPAGLGDSKPQFKSFGRGMNISNQAQNNFQNQYFQNNMDGSTFSTVNHVQKDPERPKV